MFSKLALLAFTAVLGATSLMAAPVMAQSNAPSMSSNMSNQMTQERANDQSQMATYDQKALSIPKSSQFEAISPEKEVADMGRGVNILGYDDYWNTGSDKIYNEKTFKTIRNAGFSTVRVNLYIFTHMDDVGTIDPAWLKRLDWVVATATKYNLHVILDEHDYDTCSAAGDSCGVLLNTVWTQLGKHYANEPNTVMFELLNEPHGSITSDLWNTIIPQVLSVVRQTNPERNIIIGPTTWNSIDDLPALKLPAQDHNIIVTFHYYKPMTFTHQGATWVGPDIQKLHDVHFGTPEEIATVNTDFDKVLAWSKANNRPIFLGEFGAFDKAPMDDRVTYISTVARAAEARGFATAYWQFSADFVIWDADGQKWVEPILHAVIPYTKQ